MKHMLRCLLTLFISLNSPAMESNADFGQSSLAAKGVDHSPTPPGVSAVAKETDLGVLQLGQSVVHREVMENNGVGALTIGDVESSCACVQIVSYLRQVAPAAAGEIVMVIMPDRVGDYRYEVAAETSDATTPRMSYFLNVEVVAPNASDLAASAKRNSPVGWPVRVVIAREQGLYLAAADVLTKEGDSADLAFVDARDHRLHEAAHVPESLNMPLHAVKSSAFLRSRQMVLFDEGWGNPAVEAECRRLREKGFAVWILRGGMTGWQAAGGDLEPHSAPAIALAGLQPLDYLASSGFDDWLVVDVRSEAQASENWIPDAVNIPFAGEGEREFCDIVASLVAQRREYTRLLVVGADGRESEQAWSALPSLSECTAFYLAGGYEALRQQLALGTAMAHRRTEHTGMPSGTGMGPPIPKPCGGCP